MQANVLVKTVMNRSGLTILGITTLMGGILSSPVGTPSAQANNTARMIPLSAEESFDAVILPIFNTDPNLGLTTAEEPPMLSPARLEPSGSFPVDLENLQIEAQEEPQVLPDLEIEIETRTNGSFGGVLRTGCGATTKRAHMNARKYPPTFENAAIAADAKLCCCPMFLEPPQS